MSTLTEKISSISEQLSKGVAPPKETVRSLLLWFNAEKRGYKVVRRIRSTLEQNNIATYPDFEYTWIDATISFIPLQESGITKLDNGTAIVDPTFRVGRLEAANKQPISVKPDSTLQYVVTIMLTNDFSQLPVMTNPRDLKGIISWKTIGSRLALKRPCTFARDAMEPAQVMSSDESLFEAISKISSYDYALIQSKDKTISGIVTASDFNSQFQSLAEPFLLVGEIENGVRQIIHHKFTINELKEAKMPSDDSRSIESPSDLSFGEYIRLIEPDKHWKKLKIEIDRVEFISNLNKIRDIRNDVMHFDPDGPDADDLKFLRDFAQFLKRLRDVGAV